MIVLVFKFIHLLSQSTITRQMMFAFSIQGASQCVNQIEDTGVNMGFQFDAKFK